MIIFIVIVLILLLIWRIYDYVTSYDEITKMSCYPKCRKCGDFIDITTLPKNKGYCQECTDSKEFN